ncbi:MAG: UDP-N-acetylmuramoyl-tripeptide--D-alanyl-D-alanine ligase [Clostridia bacterium]|nr:UDP-N-acetylmuramoyl-tripeptide--D-alanyl-D-alanine ligase [Clostridia bacterium]
MAARFTIQELLEATGGTLYAPSDFGDPVVDGLTIDTRTLLPGMAYVAIRGGTFDGHRFIPDAMEKGAVLSISDTDVPYPHIRVKNTVLAYQNIAKMHRERFDLPVVCITGSVGKTTTKEMVKAVLETTLRTHATVGNLNNQTGVPTTVLQISDADEVSVMELGTNHFGEIDAIARVAEPSICLFTNIGEAHIEFFGSREGIFRGKTEMLKHMRPGGTVIANGDDDYLRTIPNAITYGLSEGVDVRAVDLLEDGLSGVSFTAELFGKRLPVRLSVAGKHMVLNALAALTAAHLLHVPDSAALAALAAFQPGAGRSDIIRTERFTIIDGSYNCNPTSMEAALDVLKTAAGRKVCIFGDMLELGENASAFHARIGAYAKQCGVDRMLTVGALAKNAAFDEADAYDSVDALLYALPSLLCDGDTILVKASFGMHLKSVVDAIKAM